jgi:HSP20 family protein
MTQRDPNQWMWERATELLERADKVQRQFFHLGRNGSHGRSTWQPPIDIFESEEELSILIALPGADPRRIEVVLEHGELLVVAVRVLPESCSRAAVRRLEIPQGRFERRIALPPWRYEVFERRLEEGCLTVRLRRIP